MASPLVRANFWFSSLFFCGSYAGKPESKPYLCKERQPFFPLPRM